MPEGQPAPDGRRPEGQERRAEQGLERPLPAGQGAGEGRRRLFRHQDRLPAAGRCARRVREGRGRRLGDLGSLPGRRRGRDRRAHARRRRRASSRTTSSISPRDPSSKRIRRSSTSSRSSIAEIDAWVKGNPGDVADAVLARRSAFPRRSSKSRSSGRPTASSRSTTDVVAEQQKIADTFFELGLHPERDQDRRRRAEGRNRERRRDRERPLVPADAWRRPLSRHGASAAAPVDIDYLRQIAQAADTLGYFGVLLPTGKSCEDSWVVASALAPLTERLRFLVAVGRACSRRASPRA